ncbi:MAG: trypsin-like peptidase domain-containing protein [Acidobacteria bacterium]|nr:trypsin-like peptidase domain-containing protein [Acidobacteriota bacterium]
MPNPLLEVSDQLAAAVEAAGRYVVSVIAHPRLPASGVQWREGIIVTTSHTLKHQTSAEIAFPDGTRQTVSVAGRDPGTDLAVLRVEAGTTPVATRAAGPVRAGELSLVVGRSIRSGVTASMGLISAVSGAWRTWQGGSLDRLIQLDTAIYPASNGGAVIDVSGNIIGIATAEFSRLGGMAIPNATVDRVVETLLSNGYVPRGYLGVGMQPVAIPRSLRDQLATDTALILLTVEAGSAAEKAGLMVGDILVAIDEVKIGDPRDVQSVLGADSIGKQVTAHVIRGGALLEVPLVIGERQEAAEQCR